MPTVAFTSHLRKLCSPEPYRVGGGTVGESLGEVFAAAPKLRGYLLDDQGNVRHHVAIFLDGEPVRDRVKLTDAVRDDSDIFVAQALSGG